MTPVTDDTQYAQDTRLQLTMARNQRETKWRAHIDLLGVNTKLIDDAYIEKQRLDKLVDGLVQILDAMGAAEE